MSETKPRHHLALYAGSFDPITRGHLDVLGRARNLFDEVVLGLGHNPDKPALFTFDERREMAQTLAGEIVRNHPGAAPVRVETYTGLTVDFARSIGASAILRGIRNITDLAAECQLAITNRQVADIETVFVITGEAFAFTSSSLIRQVAALGGSVDRLKTIVPDLVVRRLKEKLADPENALSEMARDAHVEEQLMSWPEYRIISIGTLSAHPLWDEGADVRTGHATTTLVAAADAVILVNPALPGPAVEARLSERSRRRADDVTHVFLTTFSVEHYRGLARFENATWLLHEPERVAAAAALDEQLERAREIGDPELVERVAAHRALLRRCRAADDRLAEGVDLFPLPGVTPGTCGLLLSMPRATVLICGDALATVEHIQQAKVLPTCMDIETAQESFREAIDIADVLVPGRDNVMVNPLRA